MWRQLALLMPLLHTKDEVVEPLSFWDAIWLVVITGTLVLVLSGQRYSQSWTLTTVSLSLSLSLSLTHRGHDSVLCHDRQGVLYIAFEQHGESQESGTSTMLRRKGFIHSFAHSFVRSFARSVPASSLNSRGSLDCSSIRATAIGSWCRCQCGGCTFRAARMWSCRGCWRASMPCRRAAAWQHRSASLASRGVASSRAR